MKTQTTLEDLFLYCKRCEKHFSKQSDNYKKKNDEINGAIASFRALEHQRIMEAIMNFPQSEYDLYDRLNGNCSFFE